MTINWKTTESQERLVASIVASFQPAKVDYAKVAEWFGQGATYNAIKGQFGPIRKMIDKISQEAEGGASSASSADVVKPAKRASGVKKDKANGVIDGKVKKAKAKSATTKGPTKAAKLEKHIQAEGLHSGHEDNIDDLENGGDIKREEYEFEEYGTSAEALYDDEP